MIRSLTLGKQIAAGVLLPFIALLIALVPISYTNAVAITETSRNVAHAQTVILRVSELVSNGKDVEIAQRSYLLTGREEFVTAYRSLSEGLDKKFEELRRLTADSPDQQQRLDTMRSLVHDKQVEVAEMIEARRRQGLGQALQILNEGRGTRTIEELRKLAISMTSAEEEMLQKRSSDNSTASKRAILLPILSVPFCLGIMAVAVVFISRNLTRQIGTAVQHIRSSAAELQAAAGQQTKGAKGQAATATEVATTMRELVSTSRQIAESAQRVTGVAADTTAAARTGDHTVQGAQEAVEQVKRQVDRIVSHMLDLGKRTQEIGSILDIINELAEQTNILSINATIEAAGAGESGRRFSVVADEIRKLADRVGGSTKEIRSLIEEVRAAATTTVMVTEDGSKAVDASARQFGDVAASFRRIVDLLGNTAQAAREIELSTKQQTTAVEQASTAITDVAQTARETEASSGQTMETANQLASLSQQLIRLVRSSERA